MATAFQEINAVFEQFEREGSGWIIDHIVQMDINVAEYQPLLGSSYISLPKQLRAKKAIVNVQNKDTKCFLWSVLAALHPVDDIVTKHYTSARKRKILTSTYSSSHREKKNIIV